MALPQVLQGLDGNRKRLGPHAPTGQQGDGRSPVPSRVAGAGVEPRPYRIESAPGGVKVETCVVIRCRIVPGWALRSQNGDSSARRENAMGVGDKIQNAGEEAAGKVKETAGRATDNQSLEAEGRADQASANVKQAGEKAKDAVKDALD